MTSLRRHFDVMCPLGIGRLSKNGGQRSDLISIAFFYETAFLLISIRTRERKFRYFYILNEKIVRSAACLNLFLIFEDLNKINSFSKTGGYMWLKFCMKHLWDLGF